MNVRWWPPPAVRRGLSCVTDCTPRSGVPEGAEPVEEGPQREQEEAQVLLQDGGGAEGQGQDQQEAHRSPEGAFPGQGTRASTRPGGGAGDKRNVTAGGLTGQLWGSSSPLSP